MHISRENDPMSQKAYSRCRSPTLHPEPSISCNGSIDHNDIQSVFRAYKVRWKGRGSEYDTWEPEGHLTGCGELLRQWRANNPMFVISSSSSVMPLLRNASLVPIQLHGGRENENPMRWNQKMATQVAQARNTRSCSG